MITEVTRESSISHSLAYFHACPCPQAEITGDPNRAIFCSSSRDDGTKANQNATRASATNAGIPPTRVSARLVGVGIVFQQDSTVDGHHVYRKPVALLAPLILGLEGTVVRLGLQRGTLQGLVYVRPHPPPLLTHVRSVTHMCICTCKIYTLDVYLRIQVEVRRTFMITLLPQPLPPPL